ncbi:hypothetical protein NKJ09_29640 [Mesorhizobium sp. M0189]|uniref:hypothetical protein n=1 Tax=Mesorhizobium sp. M0189 TaxID=2956909 RepID=UPI0033394993
MAEMYASELGKLDPRAPHNLLLASLDLESVSNATVPLGASAAVGAARLRFLGRPSVRKLDGHYIERVHRPSLFKVQQVCQIEELCSFNASGFASDSPWLFCDNFVELSMT